MPCASNQASYETGNFLKGRRVLDFISRLSNTTGLRHIPDFATAPAIDAVLKTTPLRFP